MSAEGGWAVGCGVGAVERGGGVRGAVEDCEVTRGCEGDVGEGG